MSDIDGLHDSLDKTFKDKMDDILAVKKSANRMADRVKELGSLFDEHEVRDHSSRRTNFLGLTKHKDSMA
jgi:hypothetical protein